MIAYLLALLIVTATTIDIDTQIEAALEPANMDGYRHVQLAIEQGETRLDARPPESCYAAWWALERSRLLLLGESLRAHIEGRAQDAKVTLDAVSVLRYYADIEEVDCG